MAKKKEANKELIEFAVKARNAGVSYGMLQQMETVEMIRKKGGGNGEGKRISSAGRETESADRK